MNYKQLMMVLVVVLAGLIFSKGSAHAATFNPNDIIDDGIFDNTTSMTATQINSFLNSLPNSCISPNSGFDAIDPTGYSPTSGYTFGGFVTAGQVIYDAGQAYGLNPQVLLATLEKEQSLVAGGSSVCNSSDQNQYSAAVGYDCPDSGSTHSYTNVNLYERNGVMVTSTSATCVDKAAAAGFSQQVIRAAWLLKFGEQRSQGNVGWAIINGSWDDSDDPQSCYGGPMTQGTWKVCPNSTSTYYDGYTTIDGTSVQMDNGATAALYWYTPHLSGNESFFNIFTNWFGSTTYSQPLDGMLVVGNTSGKLYFISLNNNTYYFIPTWSTAQAYGLDRYQVMPMPDSQIDSYTNGGTLKTLVWDNNNDKIYMVDHGTKFWFQQYCSEWGLDCQNQTAGDVTFITSDYFDDVLNNGGNSQPIMQESNSLYLMQNGQREPFANTQSLLSMGYNGNQIMAVSQTDLNAAQPLGNLMITTPDFIQFSPSNELLYFDGQNYHFVPSYSMYQEWGSPTITEPVASAYNSTLPSLGAPLSSWVSNGSGNDYLIESGQKVNITSDPTQWYSGSFETLPASVLNSLPSTSQEPNISVNGNIYVIQSGAKRHVPSYNDYLWLGINPSNTLNVDSYTASTIPNGIDKLRDGAFFTVQNNPGLYMVNGNTSLHIPSSTMANDYGIDWSTIRTNLNPTVLSTAYPSSGDLSRWVNIKSTSNLLYIANENQISISSSAAGNWGITTSAQNPISLDEAPLYNVSSSVALGRFVRNETNGGVYYGSGGTYHYIGSYNTFLSMGGNMQNLINVYPDFFTNLTQGSTYN